MYRVHLLDTDNTRHILLDITWAHVECLEVPGGATQMMPFIS